jgi:hypothetical protein
MFYGHVIFYIRQRSRLTPTAFCFQLPKITKDQGFLLGFISVMITMCTTSMSKTNRMSIYQSQVSFDTIFEATSKQIEVALISFEIMISSLTLSNEALLNLHDKPLSTNSPAVSL